MELENLDVSLVFLALCAASLFLFGAWIGPIRGRLGVLRGDGGDPTLHKAMRIHGNFVENAPLFAMVLLAADLLGTANTWLWAAVISFFVGRVVHHLRYDAKERAFGMVLTTLPALLLGVLVVWRVIERS
ncbi:MAG: MAPEG family protein [Sandaracinus sp.]|nr:MAPEG family protein [Sandaracinus sp.]MCB9612308.1 MAPEG family protein [Sandaracinus sp.]